MKRHWTHCCCFCCYSWFTWSTLSSHWLNNTDNIQKMITPVWKLKVVVTLVWCLFVCSLSSMWHDTGPSLTLREPVDQRHVSPAPRRAEETSAQSCDMWHYWHLPPGRGEQPCSPDCWLHQQEDFKTSTFELGITSSSVLDPRYVLLYLMKTRKDPLYP